MASDPQPLLWPNLGDPTGTASLPEILREIVTEIAQASGAGASSVAVVALCLVAQGLGPGVKVRRRQDRSVSPIFNVVIRHDSPQPLPWFDHLCAPLVDRVLAMLNHHSRRGLTGLQDELALKEKEYEAARRTVAPDPELLARLKIALDRTRAGLAPLFVINRTHYQTVVDAASRSFDGGILMHGIQIDPAYEFTQLRKGERLKVIELLNQSWKGLPLSIGTRVVSGVVSLLWQTRVPVPTLIGPGCFDPGFFCPPLVIHEDLTRPHRLPELASTGVWTTIMNKLLDARCSQPSEQFSVVEEAESLFLNLEEDIASCAKASRHASWLPDLALRLALVFHVLTAKGPIISASTVHDATTVTQWIGCQHLRALTPKSDASGPVASTDPADRAAAMLEKIRTKAPLIRRDLWRSYNAPKAEWFNQALHDLISAQQVRYNAEGQLIPCSDGGDDSGGRA